MDVIAIDCTMFSKYCCLPFYKFYPALLIFRAMASREKFCLKWNDFESNISSSFKSLREDNDYMDVTLACEQDQISAHKVVLSACSSFFKTILKRNPHQHPLLYLRGISYSNIESLINFMYYGEVSIAQEELNSFLAVAEELQVKGLTQSESPKPSQPQSIKSKAISRSRIPPVQKAIDIDNDVD